MVKKYGNTCIKLLVSHKNNVSLQESINSVLQREILDSQRVNPEGWALFTEYHYSNITKVYTELEWE